MHELELESKSELEVVLRLVSRKKLSFPAQGK